MVDPSLFVYRLSYHTIILLLYVDDIILTGDTPSLLDDLILTLGRTFSMKDLGPLHFFLGIEVHRTPKRLFLPQSKYAYNLLSNVHMQSCKPLATPMETKSIVMKGANDPYPNIKEYRSIVGSLQYLTMTRPDLSYAVNTVCQFMHNPTISHFQMVKRILRYVSGTLHLGIRVLNKSTIDLFAFSNANWVGCPTTRSSTTGFCTFLGSNCISWSAKKQPTIARSSEEAEYRTMASTTAELTWLSFILRDIGIA